MITKAQLNEKLVRESDESFDAFLDYLVVKSGSGKAHLVDVMAAHQRQAFNALGPSLEALRMGDEVPIKRFWLERTKKASKDTDIAACIFWLLCFPRRPLLIQVGAADRKQAGIVKDRLDDFYYYNEWLQPLVKMKQYHAESHNGLVKLEIEAADIEGSHGATPDLLVCNELSHVKKWEYIQNLLDNVDGVPNSIAILATNAGFKGTDAWVLRQSIMTNERWYRQIFNTPAPWHSPEFLEDAKLRSKTPSRYKRLWEGLWSSGKGDVLDEKAIDDMFVPGLTPLRTYDPRYEYTMGIDIGVKHDHAGVVVLGTDIERQKIRLIQMHRFIPHTRTGEVDLVLFTRTVFELHQLFRAVWVGYDPHQAKLMAQMLTQKGLPMHEVTFTGKNLDVMAVTLKEVLESRALEAFDTPDARLRSDFDKFNIVERTYGIRLEATSDETGHADVGTALAIVLPKAVSLLGSTRFKPTDDIACLDNGPMREGEYEAMPDEFKELFDLSSSQSKQASWNDFYADGF